MTTKEIAEYIRIITARGAMKLPGGRSNAISICDWRSVNAESGCSHGDGLNLYTYCNNNPVNYYDPVEIMQTYHYTIGIRY